MSADIKSELVEKLEKQGVDINEVVYSICIGDIVECIADLHGEAALKLSRKKLRKLVEIGIKGVENLSWSDAIEATINGIDLEKFGKSK